MYLHEICYRGECGRKIHLNCFSTYTDKLMTNVPEPIETAAHEAYHMPHYHLPGNNLQFLFEYWKQIINWAFGKLRLGIVVRVANTIKLENISNNDITWLLLSKLFYWSGKLWLLIKMRIQAFRNMKFIFNEVRKNLSCRLGPSERKCHFQNGFMMNHSSRTLIFLNVELWYILNSSG